MAAFGSFHQYSVRCGTWRRFKLSATSSATFGLICAAAPGAQAANFTCSWNDATADWTSVSDWSNCNGTDPNNGGGNTYDVTISQGDPTLTTAITIGSVTINSPGAWSIAGTGSATLTGGVTNGGTVGLGATAVLSVAGNFTNAGALTSMLAILTAAAI
jgi:hypothetical protein